MIYIGYGSRCYKEHVPLNSKGIDKETICFFGEARLGEYLYHV